MQLVPDLYSRSTTAHTKDRSRHPHTAMHGIYAIGFLGASLPTTPYMSARFCTASGSCFLTSLPVSISSPVCGLPDIIDINVTDEELAAAVVDCVNLGLVPAIAHAAQAAQFPAPRVVGERFPPGRPARLSRVVQSVLRRGKDVHLVLNRSRALLVS